MKALFHPQRVSTSLACILISASVFLTAGEDASAQSTWTSRTTGTSKTLRGLTFNGSLFCCVADEGVILTSSDGITWAAPASGTLNSLRGVTSGPTLFVVSGEDGTILTSPDASTWTAATTPVSVSGKFLSGVAYGAGTFAAVGGSGNIIHSTDGSTWSDASSVALPFSLQSVTYGNGYFVAVGATGTILYSTDADTWLAASSGTNRSLSAVSYENGQFIIVGQSGTILTSPDGITWTSRSAGVASGLRDVTFGDGRLIAVGDSGTILTSDDGIDWDAQISGIVEAGFGIAFGAGKFVSVGGKVDVQDPGSASKIITSPTGLDLGFRWDALAISSPEPSGSVSLTIQRIGPDDSAVSCQWSVTGGTATSVDDFSELSGMIDFLSGESSKTISISIVDDSLVEPTETIELALAPLTPGWRIHGAPSATISILDDEDTDHDGLADAWEVTHFGSKSAYSGSDDPDSDGNDNLREYEANTDPDDPASALYQFSTFIASGSGSISANPPGMLLPAGTSITLTATPSFGFAFEKWTNPGFSPTETHTLLLTGDTTVGARFLLTLAEALDQPCIEWYDSSLYWEGQTDTSFDSEDAAVVNGDNMGSGDIASLETVVPGSTTVSFRWRSSTAEDLDILYFDIDGEIVDSISGETGWIEKTFDLEPGIHILTWKFERSYDTPEGLNSVWLDTVQISQSYAQWQPEHFSPLEILDLLISGENADPDVDGLSNFQEYAFGTDPWKGNGPTVSLGTADVSGEPRKAINFKRPAFVKSLINYTVEVSDALTPASWSTPGNFTEETVSEAGHIQTLRLVEDTAAATDRMFFRLKAEAN